MKKLWVGVSLFLSTLSALTLASSVVSLGGGGGSGITQINSETGATQSLAVGTSGTDFAVVSSGDTHTFNLPDASATARGLVTTGAQTIAGAKTLSSAPILSASTASTVAGYNGSKALGSIANGTNGQVMTMVSGAPAFADASSGGVTTVGTFSGSSQSNGASISSSTITFGPADGTNAGMVSTAAQTWAGAKTFSDTTATSSSTTGAIITGGGIGAAKNIFTAANIYGQNLQLNAAATAATTSGITTGAADGINIFAAGTGLTGTATRREYYGPSHAGAPGDIRDYSNNALVYIYDKTAGAHAWYTAATQRLAISSAGLSTFTGAIKTTDATAATSATTGSGIFAGGLGISGDSYFLNAKTFYCVTDGGCNLGKDNNVAGTGANRWNVLASTVTTNTVNFGENSSTVSTNFSKLSTTSIAWKSGGNTYVAFGTGYNTLDLPKGGLTTGPGEQFALIPGGTAVITTTDATVTNFYTASLGAFTNFGWNYETTCIGRNSSGGNVHKFRKDFVVTNVSGTVTLLDSSAVGTDYNPDTLGGIDANIASNIIAIRVTGKASTTVKWWCTIERQLVG